MTVEVGTSLRRVRAVFTESTVTVYQAYPLEIAAPAVAVGTLVPPFQVGRITWLKPSFLWTMHRSGWATKPGREHLLAIEITREGFDWALANSVLNSFEPGTHDSIEDWEAWKQDSKVRVQWVSERSLNLAPVPYRSIQVGLIGEAAHKYVDEWITSITDMTKTAHQIRDLVAAGNRSAAGELIPVERHYELPEAVQRRIGMTV